MSRGSYTRRTFIGKCLGITMLAIGGAAVSSCNNGGPDKKGQKGNAGSGSCDDLSGVSQSEIEKRKKFGYVKESMIPGSHCGNCGLYVPPAPEGNCGDCLLFKGPVRATGYCTQYVAKS